MKKYKLYVNSPKTEAIEIAKNGNYPKRYRSEFIEPGLCSYEDLGAGVIYISSETLEKMNPTFIGKPVVNVLHEDLTPEEAFKLSNKDLESKADGVVYDVGKLPNGWFYNDMIIWDLETQKNIEENGYSVSCAYIVEDVSKGGKYHEIPYDEEVKSGVYTHNAIVENPRYEGAKIYELPVSYQNNKADEVLNILKNSKGEEKMSKIFKHLLNGVKGKEIKNQPPEEEKKETPQDEEMQNMEGAMIEVDGEKISLEEAIAAYKAMKENAEEPTSLSPEDVVDVDGEKVNVSDLIAACQYSKENRQNAEPPQDEVAEDVVDQKQNSVAPKKEGKYFKVLKNAANATREAEVYVNTKDQRLKRGKVQYGSKEGV